MSNYIRRKLKGKRIFEHRLIMQDVVQRNLTEDEVIHHINGIKNDNRPENLVIMSRSKHMKLHQTGKRKSERHKHHIALKMSYEKCQSINSRRKRCRKKAGHLNSHLWWHSAGITQRYEWD